MGLFQHPDWCCQRVPNRMKCDVLKKSICCDTSSLSSSQSSRLSLVSRLISHSRHGCFHSSQLPLCINTVPAFQPVLVPVVSRLYHRQCDALLWRFTLKIVVPLDTGVIQCHFVCICKERVRTSSTSLLAQ